MKKAILLAGGRGTRLAPLTDGTPKPLMPFFDKTVIEHLLFRLAAYGIRKVMISVGYLADEIQKTLGYRYAGMTLCYLSETTPLGTAGGLIYAEKLLSLSKDEDFLVLSGDCLCDFDFSLGEAYHKETGAEATIFTTESDFPCEYGIVLSDKDGRVYGFNEKPSWSQVNGNRINTGIYILNSRILSRIPPRAYDFSNDLFPETVKAGTLYEYPATGYWCDIGSPESYFACQSDALNGKIGGIDAHGLTAEELLKHGCTVHAPFYVSPDAVVALGSIIGPNAVIGAGCKIGEGSRVCDCILHPNVRVEAGCTVKKAILCRNTTLRKGSYFSNKILAGGMVYSSEKAEKEPSETFPLSSFETVLFARDSDGAYFLGSESEFPAGEVSDFGSALAKAVGSKEKIGLLCDREKTLSFYTAFLSEGVRRAGGNLTDCGTGFLSLARFLAVKLHFDCFVFLSTENGKIKARLFNRNGLCPSHDFERRLFAARKAANTEYGSAGAIGKISFDCSRLYETALIENFCAYLDFSRKKPSALPSFSIAFSKDSVPKTPEEHLFRKVFLALSGKILTHEQATREGKPILTFLSDGDFLISQENSSVDSLTATALILQKECRMGQTEFCLSQRSPLHFSFLFTPSSVLHRYPEESSKRFRFPRALSEEQYFLRDPYLLCARLISLLCGENTTLSVLSHTVVPFGFQKSEVTVENEKEKMRVIASLSEKETKEKAQEKPDEYEGIRIEYPLGTATVIPERTMGFRILTEAESFEAAHTLCEEVEKIISDTAKSAKE